MSGFCADWVSACKAQSEIVVTCPSKGAVSATPLTAVVQNAARGEWLATKGETPKAATDGVSYTKRMGFGSITRKCKEYVSLIIRNLTTRQNSDGVEACLDDLSESITLLSAIRSLAAREVDEAETRGPARLGSDQIYGVVADLAELARVRLADVYPRLASLTLSPAPAGSSGGASEAG